MLLKNKMNVLLTGGAGYIGSHVFLTLIDKGYNPIILDNFSNSRIDVIKKLDLITKKKTRLIKGSVLDTELLVKIIKDNDVSSVIHLAGLKSVKESVIDPLKYYYSNILGAISLLKALKLTSCNNLVFSSSATVYGIPDYLPIDESHNTNPINPYGSSKLIIENIISDVVKSNKNFKAVVLRYFNPIGSHVSGLIGEQPIGFPNNIMPILVDIALKRKKELNIYGNDYNTKDGTGVRDYIHVMDLAEGHFLALDKLDDLNPFSVFNLGTGFGYSVLEIVQSFSKASKMKIPFVYDKRREGDLDEIFADPSYANKTLNFRPKYSIDDMCNSILNFVDGLKK
jgi:UDP-glucose 4-epimerase